MHIKDFDPYDFSKTEINGVPVYYKNLPWAPCIHVRWAFSAGAFSDPVGNEGVAHFLEHMLGNGSPLVPDKKALKEFSRLYMLNSRNAFTSHYQTAYTGKCLPEHFSRVMTVMKDYVFNSFLREEDAEHERKVITQEAWERYKNTLHLAYKKEAMHILYHGHPHERTSSPLGWPDTIAGITPEDIRTFHAQNYIKENLTIFLVGSIEEKDLVELESILASLPSGTPLTLPSGVLSAPLVPRMQKTGEEIGDPREQAEFSVIRAMHHITEKQNEIGSHLRFLLNDILFERMRTELSLCYGVSVHFQRRSDHLFTYIGVDTSSDKLELVEHELWNVLEEVVEGKWRERFVVLHRLALDQLRSAERSSSTILNEAAEDLLVNRKIIPLKEIIQNAEQVTYKDIVVLLQEVFNKEYILTEIILPSF